MPRSTVRYVPPPNLARDLANDPGPRRVIDQTAAEAEAGAVQIGLSIADTGAYARSIRRDGATVYSTDPAAHIIEWGSVNNPPFAPLRRSVDATGARLEGG